MRSTIVLHKLNSDSSHLDIFFELQEILESYEAKDSDFEKLIEKEKVLCRKKNLHRKVYLDYEGEISNGRGHVKVLWRGNYANDSNIFPEQVNICLIDSLTLKVEL